MLLEKFETLIDTPEAVEELRKLILDAAMRGKLVPQDPNDEPASILLEKINQKKSFGRNKNLCGLSNNEKPYPIPEKWIWAYLGDIVALSGGNGFPKHKQGRRTGDYPFLKVSDLSSATSIVVTNSVNWISKEDVKQDKYKIFPKGTIVFPKIGGALLTNNRRILGRDSAIDNNCMGAIPYEMGSTKYIYYFLRTIDMKDFAAGTSVPSISKSVLEKIPFPLPPLNEQKRIVAKLDQLMAFCDRLKETINQRQKQADRLNKSAFTYLQQSQSKKELENNLKFALNNFNVLCTRKEDVQLLRQTILSLAVQGKLVPQDPNDEPASALLKRIKEEKERLVKEGKIRKQKPLPPIKEEEIPYEVPEGWEWVRLGEIGILNPRNNAEDNTEASFVPMRMIPTKLGSIHQFERRRWGEIKSGYTHFAENDVVVAKITPCFENGKSAVMKNLINGIGAGTTELHVFRPLGSSVLSEYVLIFFKSPHFINTCTEKMTGTAGQKRVPKEIVINFPFPLAPLNEQKRIVAKVNQVMSLCDQLEEQLERSNQASDQLLQSILKKAFSNQHETVPV